MPQERLYRTEGIVLREMDYAEADRILTLITPGGKLRAVARGIRRATSRKVGHLGLFYRARLMLAAGRDLDTITQAESIEEYEGIRHDLLRFAYACYAGELVEQIAQEEEACESLYELIGEALRGFAVERDVRLWARYFELRLLACSGYQPQLFTCVSCGTPIRPETNYFGLQQGGLFCNRCGQGEPKAKPLSINAQKVLRYLQRQSAEAVRAVSVSEATHAEVEEVLQDYLEYTLERGLKSVAFLRRLRHELRSTGEQRQGTDGRALEP